MRIGSYEILERIAKGATATVFRARRLDGRLVAIKILGRCEPEIIARFEREKRLLRQFAEERGFVPMLDSGRSGEGPYIVMPFIEGGTLRDRLMKGALGVDDTITLGHEVALALGIAHANGIAHRDMKPENILFTKDGVPLVTDLGLAKHFMFGETLSISQTGAFTGTAGYAAPEQVRDAKSAGPASDVFSLGAILYECLTGTPAFRGDDVIELFRRVAQARYEPLGVKARGVPTWLSRVIEKSLARLPADRYPHGVALAQALEGGEWGSPRRARPIGTYVLPPPRMEDGDELDIPPSIVTESTGDFTEVMNQEPTVPVPDTADFTARPPDAPQTLVIDDIPFVVNRKKKLGSTIAAPETTILVPDPSSGPDVPRAAEPPPPPRWPWILFLVALAVILVLLVALRMRS